MIKEYKIQKSNSEPFLSISELEKSDTSITDMKINVNNLKKKLNESTKNAEYELRKWKTFDESKNKMKEYMENLTEEIDQSHKIRKSVHGTDYKDKETLLHDNELRLSDLINQEKEINDIIMLAKELHSEIPLVEATELKEVYKEKKIFLEKEICQNRKDSEDHKYFQEELSQFTEWLRTAEKLNTEIQSTPDNKDGLKSKQHLLEQLNGLKSPGNNKLNDLKNMLNTVLIETAPEYKEQISSEFNEQMEKFNNIFKNLENNNDRIVETISKLENLEEKCKKLSINIENVDIELGKSLDESRESVAEKEKMDKELCRYNRLLDQQRNEIMKLKEETEDLTQDSKTDILLKIQMFEKSVDILQEQINEELSKNKIAKDLQLMLENKLSNLESFITQFEDHIVECSAPPENEKSVEENIKKIEKLKTQLPFAKTLLEEIIKSRNQFDPPEQCLKSCDNNEQKFFDVENEIICLEKSLEMSKNNWATFNSEKEELENWIDSVNTQMLNLNEKNQGIHGGNLEDKERLLDLHRNLLEDVINHESEIKGLIDHSTPLATSPTTDSPKRVTNSLCKKYEKILESLTNIVQENQIDLDMHEKFEMEIEKFNAENNKIIKELNNQIANQPNNKNGLKAKSELYEEIKKTYNERATLLPSLEKMKEDIQEHSSPKSFQNIEHIWDKVIDTFGKTFSKSNENQSKLFTTLENLENTESVCKELESKIHELESKRDECLLIPISATNTPENMLSTLKNLRYEINDLQSGIDQINRKTNELPMLKDEIEKIKNDHKSLKESVTKDISLCENTSKDLQNFNMALNNIKTWLEHSKCTFNEQLEIDNIDSDCLKQKLIKLKILQDDIAAHKVDLSRLQSQIDPLIKITHDRSLTDIAADLSSDYSDLHDQCQNSIEKYDYLVKLMGKYENSRASVLHWIDANTQILLKCSDYNMNSSQIRSKLLMIENVEKDLEFSGQLKFVETIQNGEELVNGLTGMGRTIIERQVNDLTSDWTEICRQLNHLANNLKNSTSKSDAFREIINNLSAWLDDMEHAGMSDCLVVDHHCQRPLENMNQGIRCERVKTLLAEVERRKPEFDQLRHITLEMANPSSDLENSQIQTRFTKLQNNLKEKADTLEKQEADFDKIKQDIENLEKWIFQTSMQIINENIEQNDRNKSVDMSIDAVIEQSNDIIQSILEKEPEILQMRQDLMNVLDRYNGQANDKSDELKEDFEKMECNFNNLKSTSVNKKINLLESVDKWKNYQKLLETAKDFLDNDVPKCLRDQKLSPLKASFSNKDKENELRDIEDVEQKIVALKRNVERAAQECEGIPPKISNALSRSQTPNFQFFKNSPRQSPLLRPNSSFSNSRNNTRRNSPCMDQSSKPKQIFEQIEDNLTKLSEQKKDLQNKYSDWNAFNREKSAFINWFDNEKVKFESTLQSSPKATTINSFQRNKLNNIQDEIIKKKPVLTNLMNRYGELTKDSPSLSDPTLTNINQEFYKMEKEVAKLLNREDKEVEADFTEDDSRIDFMDTMVVPQLSLNSERSPFMQYASQDNLNRFTQTLLPNSERDSKKPLSANFSCQTPSTKKTQTQIGDVETDNSESSRYSSRSNKKEQLFSIASKINEIRTELDKTKHPYDRGSSPISLSSRRLRLPNQESVRKNMIPSQQTRKHHARELPDIDQINSISSNHGGSFLEISSPSSLHNRDLEEFVPAKDKWHDLEVFLQSTPRISESIHRPVPDREFQVAYQPVFGRNGKKSKKSNIYEELKRLTKDSQDLRSMDKELRY